MFLRANKRFKDGKEHRYWSVAENRRAAGGRSVQKTLLYLGEINDSDRAGWTRAIEAVDERDQTRQIHLFPEDRTPDPRLEHPTLKLRLDHIELARPRQWGGCRLAMELWNRLDLDAFWQPLLPDSQKGTPWLKVLKTLAGMLEKITARYGKERRTWIMDRGIPTEEDLGKMRRTDPSVRYLVGTPKGRLTKLEKDLAAKDWQQVKDDVHVKLLHRDGELYVLARSLPRRGKESAMRRKKLKAYWERLKELQKRHHLTRDDLLLAIGAAKQKAGRNAHRLVILHLPDPGTQVTTDTLRIEPDRQKLKATRRHEGQYLLRGNLTGEDSAELWRNYIHLVRIEESFRTLKGDLGLRPVFHQLDERIEAHVFISFLAYCLHVTLEQYNKKAATDGRELRMKRYTKPEKVHHLLLDQLGFTLPAHPPPEIRNPKPVVETF